jgi:hypothetical protein
MYSHAVPRLTLSLAVRITERTTCPLCFLQMEYYLRVNVKTLCDFPYVVLPLGAAGHRYVWWYNSKELFWDQNCHYFAR